MEYIFTLKYQLADDDRDPEALVERLGEAEVVREDGEAHAAVGLRVGVGLVDPLEEEPR